MRKLLVVCVATLAVAMFATVLQAAPPVQTGEVPDAVLADLGMAGMERVSDAQGEAIRGKWFFSKEVGSWARTTYNLLNTLPGPTLGADMDVGGGTGPSFGGAPPTVPTNTWDISYGLIPAGETIPARVFRNQVNLVNQIFAAHPVFGAGIPGTNFGPGTALGAPVNVGPGMFGGPALWSLGGQRPFMR